MNTLVLSYIFLITIFWVVYCEEQYCPIDNPEDCIEKKEDNIYKKGMYRMFDEFCLIPFSSISSFNRFK